MPNKRPRANDPRGRKRYTERYSILIELRMKQAYRAIADKAEYVHEEKRSTFTALLHPVRSREEAMATLQAIRLNRPGASHYCWAYVLGDALQPQTAAFNDDGEPSGTAGRPMLNVLMHREAGDCFAVVVRFFGGVKLGAGGLVRAYGAAVSGALDQARWYSVEPLATVRIATAFANEQKVRHFLQVQGADHVQAAYGERVEITARVAKQQCEAMAEALAHLTSGQAKMVVDS